MTVHTITPTGMLLMALRARRRILRAAGLGAGLAAAVAVLLPRTWTAAVVFAPATSEGGISRLAGFAAQFGVDIGSGDGAQGPEFYAKVVRSRQVLLRVVDARYAYDARSGLPLLTRQRHYEGTLADLYEIAPDLPAAKRSELAVQQLLSRLDIQFDLETGLVSVAVEAPHAEQAVAIVREIVAALNTFNLESRRSQARAEREFVESRLREAEAEVRLAEQRLQGFLQHNQQFRQSSTLAFEQDRFQQDLTLKRGVLSSLAQAYEQSRIEEVRSTPVISIVDPPRQPPFPERRRLGLKVILGALLGMTAAVTLQLIAAARVVLRDRSPEWRELEEALGLPRPDPSP